MVTLVIMDGFGIRNMKKGNAIKLAGTPYLEKLKKIYPYTELSASGNAVGLPKNQMGNSETGHLTIGAGRRIYQPLEKINKSLADKSFYSTCAFLKVMKHVKKHKSALHIIGMISDGGIHSHIDHIKALVKMAHDNEVQKIYLHAITDGRDSKKDSALGFIRDLDPFCKANNCEIKTVVGRVYAMDREQKYARTKKAYNAIVLGKSHKSYNVAENAVEESYAVNVYDEYVEPTRIGEKVEIGNNDGVIFANLRKDRMRQLVDSISNPKFKPFSVKKIKGLKIASLVQYDDDFKNIAVAFPAENVTSTLAEVISNNKLEQFHISETTKFAHITYYLNGGREEPFRGETRKLIDTINDIDFASHPKMRAFEITTETLDAIASGKYSFIVVNLSNCDMIGHTADMEATKTAVRVVDKCAYAIAMACIIAEGDCIITADHGNAEELLNDDGTPKTSHTTNPVPFLLVSKHKYRLKSRGELSNIAPTVLELLNLDPPAEMSESLLKR